MKYFYLATFISLCSGDVDITMPTIDCPASQHVPFGSDTSTGSTGVAICASGSTVTSTDSSTPHCEAAVTSKCCSCTDHVVGSCSDIECITTICSFNSWCCHVLWDDLCDAQAEDICVDGAVPIVKTITRTFTCDDGSASCPQEIHIVDTTKPSADCPPDITLAFGADISPDALGSVVCIDNEDANPVASFSDSSVSGECNEVQLISRSWECTDCVGNIASCVQQIVVGECTEDCASVGINFGSDNPLFAHSCECQPKCEGSYCHNVRAVARQLKDTHGASLSPLPDENDMCESGSCCCSCEDCDNHIIPIPFGLV